MSFFKKKEFEILNNTDQLVRDGRVGITFTKLSESFSYRELPINAPKPTLYHSKFDAIVGADKLTRRSLDLSSKEKLIGFNLKEIKNYLTINSKDHIIKESIFDDQKWNIECLGRLEVGIPETYEDEPETKKSGEYELYNNFVLNISDKNIDKILSHFKTFNKIHLGFNVTKYTEEVHKHLNLFTNAKFDSTYFSYYIINSFDYTGELGSETITK